MDPIDPAEIPLRDIHLPEPISWWPLAPGWWILLASLIMIAVIAFLVWRFMSRRQLRRAERALTNIEQRYQSHRDDHQLARELSVWARQFAQLQAAGKASPNSSIGSDWVEYWQGHVADTALSKEELHHALTVAPYRRNENIDAQKLTAGLRAAIKQSRQPNWTENRDKQAA